MVAVSADDAPRAMFAMMATGMRSTARIFQKKAQIADHVLVVQIAAKSHHDPAGGIDQIPLIGPMQGFGGQRV